MSAKLNLSQQEFVEFTCRKQNVKLHKTKPKIYKLRFVNIRIIIVKDKNE